jgi:hypothetical protein
MNGWSNAPGLQVSRPSTAVPPLLRCRWAQLLAAVDALRRRIAGEPVRQSSVGTLRVNIFTAKWRN